MQKETKEETKEEKKEEVKESSKTSQIRQIVIETDGNSVRVVKFEGAGSLEFKAILLALLENLNK
jgi:hypothetical protein